MRGADPSRGAESWGDTVPSVSVPDIRDYAKINAELVSLLDLGHRHVRLVGVDGQRLLASGLRGAWCAVLEIDGNAGPELAADLDAPGLSVICIGSALDGAGRGLRQGRLLIAGDAGNAVGTFQTGGTIAVAGRAGHRLALRQSGGLLVVAGEVGRLAIERQSGGRVIVLKGPIGAHAGHGRSGGEFRAPGEASKEDLALLDRELSGFGSWLPASLRPPRAVE